LRKNRREVTAVAVPESRLLIIFVKAPRPGFVKTRLAATIGVKAASEAYCQMFEELRRELGSLRNVQLRFSPSDAASEIPHWRGPGWTMSPQGEGDLGARLTTAFADAFAAGAQRIAVIGSDCPYLTVNDIEQAWASLSDYDVVLGPARDGGYWLVALRQLHREIFREIPWGTGDVLEHTLERARAAHLRVHLLRKLSDIDTAADWREYLNSFASRRPLG
jgi:rSAM/selenodomain-associated transferase 1